MKFLRTSLAALCLPAMLIAGEPRPAYLDPSQPVDLRVQDLVSRMTLEEKASMTSNATPGVPRLGIPKYNWWSEGLHGVARAGTATVFPQAIGMAAMWDAPLHQRIAHTTGIEGRAKFNEVAGTPLEGAQNRGLTFWSPNINIFRDPRWGRGQETYGEDPFLTASLGTAFVRGLQGDNPDYLLAAACAKHFAVHSGPEPERHDFDASPSQADLHETYLPAFEALVRDGDVEIVMMAYNSLYGVPCSISPFLYGQLANWGFTGHITSDCGSVEDLVQTYKLAPDQASAEAMSLKAGMDVRCGFTPSAMVESVKRGLLPEEQLDARVGALLRTMFRLGLFDPKERVPFNTIAPSENNSPEHAALALQAARESLVLLKNDGTLPLDRAKLKRIAVIGPNADSVPALLGNYNGDPTAPVTVVAGLKAALGRGVAVACAHGCEPVGADGAAVPISGSNLTYAGKAGIHWALFASGDLGGAPIYQDTVSAIAFDLSPYPLANGVFSAHSEADLTAHFAGDYVLSVEGHGGVRLYLGDELVIDNWDLPGDVNASVKRTFAAGERLPLKLDYHHVDGPPKIALKWTTPPAESGFAEALAAAKQADAVVFVGGISASLEGEEMAIDLAGFKGGDRTRIELPDIQHKLLEQLVATGKPVVFVNMSGSAMAFPWEAEHVNAIVQAWYPGQAGGAAVADVLLGDYNPAGRLPVTFYRATEDMPSFESYDMAGRTYRYFKGTPLYAFGHGLSFTRFDYANLHVVPGAAHTLAVTVDVTNSGARDGDEVVQLYAVPPLARENEALCGFARMHLKAGESRSVAIEVPAAALRRWNEAKGGYVYPTGEWTIRAGASSADIRQTAFVEL